MSTLTEAPPTWEVLRNLLHHVTSDPDLEKLLQQASATIERDQETLNQVRGLLGAALDEIWELRAALAIEAQETLKHAQLATFPKSRRYAVAEQVERQRQAARGEVFDAYRSLHADQKPALREAGADTLLTQGTWVNERRRTAGEL